MHGEERSGIRLVAASDLGGYGDGMQVMRQADALYVAHFGPSAMGTSFLDISDRANPNLVRQIEAPAGAHNHKVQIADALPEVRSVCPTQGEEFCLRGLRYGAHCLHENRPGQRRGLHPRAGRRARGPNVEGSAVNHRKELQ